jgi:hypothetical protein
MIIMTIVATTRARTFQYVRVNTAYDPWSQNRRVVAFRMVWLVFFSHDLSPVAEIDHIKDCATVTTGPAVEDRLRREPYGRVQCRSYQAWLCNVRGSKHLQMPLDAGPAHASMATHSVQPGSYRWTTGCTESESCHALRRLNWNKFGVKDATS